MPAPLRREASHNLYQAARVAHKSNLSARRRRKDRTIRRPGALNGRKRALEWGRIGVRHVPSWIPHRSIVACDRVGIGHGRRRPRHERRWWRRPRWWWRRWWRWRQNRWWRRRWAGTDDALSAGADDAVGPRADGAAVGAHDAFGAHDALGATGHASGRTGPAPDGAATIPGRATASNAAADVAPARDAEPAHFAKGRFKRRITYRFAEGRHAARRQSAHRDRTWWDRA